MLNVYIYIYIHVYVFIYLYLYIIIYDYMSHTHKKHATPFVEYLGMCENRSKDIIVN